MSFSPLQASLQVTRAVKLQRISMEGGYSAENMAILVIKTKQNVRGRVWCPVRPDLSLFERKVGKIRKRNNKDVVNPNPKTRRTTQKSKT